MPSSFSTFSCPFCAESIQGEAKECRFCGKPILWHLQLTKCPPNPALAETTKEVFEFMKNHRPTSYGKIRKSLNLPQTLLFKNCTQIEADEISKIVAKHQGEVQPILAQPHSPTKFAKSLFWILSVVSLFFFSLPIYKKFFPLDNPRKMERVEKVVKKDSVVLPKKSPSTDTTPHPQKEVTETSKTREPSLPFPSLIQGTVMITGDQGIGSGFFVSKEGHIVTNFHVIQNMPSLSVFTWDGKSHPGKILKTHLSYDLALLQIDSRSYSPLPFGDATTLEQGEPVWTIGAPQGLSFTLNRGIVSYVGRKINGRAYIQADVDINPGNSGGPMINQKGEVVGINAFIFKNAQGLNFAIPVNYLFMGTEAITRDFLPLHLDNAQMAKWREWEKEAPSNSYLASSSSEDSSLREWEQTKKEFNQITHEFLLFKTRQEEKISQLESQLVTERLKNRNFSKTISEEIQQEKLAAKISQELIQIKLEGVNQLDLYCKKIEQLLKSQESPSKNFEPFSEWVSQKQIYIRDLKSQATTLKMNLLEELQKLKEKRY